MARGHVVVEGQASSAQEVPASTGASPVQPTDSTLNMYGALSDKEALMPHVSMSDSQAERRQKRFRRIALLITGIVIVVKIVILLSAHDSAKSKHAQALHAPAPDAQQNVWHAATPNHMRPGFSHPTSRPWHPEAGDVTFH